QYYNVSDSETYYLPDSLTSVTVSGNLNYGAFYDCSHITDITVNGGGTVGDKAFRNCTALTYAVLDKDITDIGVGAFAGCSSLAEITLPFAGKSTSAINSEALFGYIFGSTSYPGSYTALQYYTSSDYVSFELPSALKEITISGNSLGYGVFSGCTYIEKVILSGNITELPALALYGCNHLVDFVIPPSITSLYYAAFMNCTSLTGIIIPSAVTLMGSDVFQYCFALTIYCRAASKPSGWSANWNSGACPVVWGYTG
ncbi:MAG: leucine-rich repeat domain-containing protein, partial [Clostridia bacterium]|nr:leucine-rich repeat domain-containing protein [Clostridia bacterium]